MPGLVLKACCAVDIVDGVLHGAFGALPMLRGWGEGERLGLNSMFVRAEEGTIGAS